jgi:hypothetical protein
VDYPDVAAVCKAPLSATYRLICRYDLGILQEVGAKRIREIMRKLLPSGYSWNGLFLFDDESCQK